MAGQALRQKGVGTGAQWERDRGCGGGGVGKGCAQSRGHSAESSEERALRPLEETAGRPPPGVTCCPMDMRAWPFPEDPSEDWPETAPGTRLDGNTPWVSAQLHPLAPERPDARSPAGPGASALLLPVLPKCPTGSQGAGSKGRRRQGEGSGPGPWLLSSGPGLGARDWGLERTDAGQSWAVSSCWAGSGESPEARGRRDPDP